MFGFILRASNDPDFYCSCFVSETRRPDDSILFFRTKSWSAFIRFGITQKSGFISISFFFRVIIGSIVIGFRIWAAVKILTTSLEEIVPVPVGIVEVNFTLVLINTGHFCIDIVSDFLEPTRVQSVSLLATAFGDITQNPLLEAGSDL